MKKMVALLLTLAMMLGMAACGSNPANNGSDNSAANNGNAVSDNTVGNNAGNTAGDDSDAADSIYPEETVKIGFVNYDTTAQQTLILNDYFAYLKDFLNIDVIMSESLNSAEAELDFIEQCASAGCKAIIGYYNVAKEESVNLAAELGMYYWGQAMNEQVVSNCSSNPYWLGGQDVGDTNYLYGRTVVEELIEQGCRKLILVTGGKDMGVDIFIDRYAGMTDAIADAQKEGIEVEVVYEVPGFPGTEEFNSHQTAALATGADGLASALTALMWVQPIQAAGKVGQIKIAAVDSATDDMVGLMEAGIYVAVAAEIPDNVSLAIPMILNAVTGHAEEQRNPDGTAPIIGGGYWTITSVEEMKYFANIESVEGGWCFDVDDLKSIMYDFNPDVTFEDMTALYSAVSMEEIEARRG